nr:hypothetical protein [Tanacetum cinerariifolium]
MAFMTAPSTSSTNDVNAANPAYEASTVSPNVNTVSPQVSTANFSDNAVYAFMVENPKGSNLLQQDLEKIHEDDLEAIDLRWQLSPLSMRAKRECRAQSNQDGQFKNQDNTRKQGNNKDTSSKAMLAIDGVGFEWSDMTKEQVQTNMALMAFSDSKVNNDKSCTKPCLKNYGTLKKQCDDLIVKLNQTEFTAATYKRGLATVEEQLVTYKKNEVLFGYHAVPPPHPLIYNGPTKLDLCYPCLDEFKEPEFNSYGSRDSKQESNITHDKKSGDSKENSDDSFVKEQVSEETSSFVESPLNIDKENVFSIEDKGKPQKHDKGFIDSGCSRQMTRNIAYLLNFKEFDEGYVTLGGGAHGGRISGKGSGPRCQDTILGDVEAQTRFEAASKQFNDPPLSRVNTFGCGEDIIKLKELMDFCTTLSE